MVSKNIEETVQDARAVFPPKANQSKEEICLA
jgi:hypothetical protein